MGIDSKKVYSFLKSKAIRGVGEEDRQGKSDKDDVKLRLRGARIYFTDA